MATRNYWERFSCPICGEGFTLAQWEVRHNGRNGEEYHKDCCPECKDGTAYDDDDDDPQGDVYEDEWVWGSASNSSRW